MVRDRHEGEDRRTDSGWQTLLDVGKTMNVFLGTLSTAWSVSRIISALSANLPSNLERVNDPAQAELIVLHVTGRNEHTIRYAQEILSQGKKYAVIQYALKSTRNPDPQDWYPLWQNAKVVWSYYDLKEHIPNFYHAPLAAGSDLFYPQEAKKKYIVGTVGNCYQAECVGEVQLAAWQTGARALHIGENFNSNPIVDYVSGVSDDQMRELYCSCMHMASLRRKEGFEMTAVEALLCGVRPIMFDTPNYRQWFDGLAEFIPEGTPKNTTGRLKKIFKSDVKPVTDDEIEETKKRFDWKRSVGGFWERCL